MPANMIHTLKAALFSIGTGAIVGGLWLGLAAWLDPQPGFFMTRTSHTLLGIIFGLAYGSAGGGLLSLIIVLTRSHARKSAIIGLVVGALSVSIIAYYFQDPTYIVTALILIPGGALIGAGTARLLGRA